MDDENDRLLMVVRDAWVMMDATELIKVLHPSFVYEVPPINRRVPCSEYPKYISDKFRNLKAIGYYVNVSIEPDTKSEHNIIRLSGKSQEGKVDVTVIRIETINGRIRRLVMDNQ